MISIIVPIYNGAQFLDECVKSVLQQDCREWELLLVDDGSTDDTPKICQSYLKDGRIKYIWKENSGVQETRWCGISMAKYEYITFLDADDILLPCTIGTLNKLLGQYDIITFGMQTFSATSEIEPVETAKDISAIFTDKTVIMKKILSGQMLSCVWGGVYKRKMLLGCRKLFCNGLKIGEDTMFNTELAYAMSPSVAVLPSKMYCYRTNSNSVSHTYNHDRHYEVYRTIMYLEDFLQRNKLYHTLRSEAGFRILLLWSSFMFHPDNDFYHNKAIRHRMKRLYFTAFRYLYPYLKVYLFIDLFLLKIGEKWK